MPRKYDDIADRIIANSALSLESVYRGTACWEWLGNTLINRAGVRYGRLSFRKGGKVVKELAHRVVVRDVKGRRLTRRMVVAHLCNNTLCVNPEHLAGGSQRSNIRQCVREGRHRTPFRRGERQS